MTARERLHLLVDELSEAEAENAQIVVEDAKAAARTEREIDLAIVESYTRLPQDQPDEWGNLSQQTDALMSEAMRDLDAEERTTGLPPWKSDNPE